MVAPAEEGGRPEDEMESGIRVYDPGQLPVRLWLVGDGTHLTHLGYPTKQDI